MDDDEIREIALGKSPGAKYPAEVVRMFRRRMQFISAANDERDIRAMKSLRLEKLSGDLRGMHSIRINDQWRLTLRFVKRSDGKSKVVAVAITDYH